ncbi:MAG: amidophosphoribosyltransferase [Candidatus Methanofastidiosa archaeon]|nr:amidophosphoribosyltransferase [Candidatus Methanofastidiosa archaeon]
MCGIIGLYDKEASWAAYRSLLAIQHRGQNAAGILTLNSKFYLKTGNGLVTEVFNGFPLDGLKGDLAIGHVRYPTSGDNPLGESQPFFLQYPHGLGLAHNGNLTNYLELKRELRAKERTLQTTSDTEVLLNVFADELLKSDPITSLEGTMNKVEGSYSSVILLGQDGGKVIAFRDPHGIRPLVIGEKDTENGKEYMACSESVGLDVTGYELIRDVRPGEMVTIKRGGIEFDQIMEPKPAHCCFEYVYISRPDSIIEGKSVYDVRFKLGENIDFSKDVDVVIPVPDTSRTAALGFALKNNLPYREGLIKNRYIGRTFIMPCQKYREEAVIEKLNVIRKEVSGKRIALVDDSIVRGTTSRRLVTLLRKYGAKEVHFISSCPPITNPCYYGIDMSVKDELVASKGIGDIEGKIGADSVTYQTIEGLVRAIGMPRSKLCLACLNGEYPTNLSCSNAECLSRNRELERRNMKI